MIVLLYKVSYHKSIVQICKYKLNFKGEGLLLIDLDNLVNIKTIQVLEELARAGSMLGELNGILRTLIKPEILLNAITLSEAKSSSEIENIITTYDEIFSELSSAKTGSAAKEVLQYQEAIQIAMKLIESNNFISTNTIVDIHHVIEPSKGGIRNQSGTVIKNDKTGDTIYTPPQSEAKIRDELRKLEIYINSTNSVYDPLIDMALIHYQFEAIHPFFDGNGRTGRVLNVAFLVLKNKLKYPVLYLSRYILKNKQEYYKLLQDIQNNEESIVDFVVYILKGITETASSTILFIEKINEAVIKSKESFMSENPSMYKSEIIDFIFSEFYLDNETYTTKMGVSRNTSTKILKALVKLEFLTEEKAGKKVIYKNKILFRLLESWY